MQLRDKKRKTNDTLLLPIFHIYIFRCIGDRVSEIIIWNGPCKERKGWSSINYGEKF